LLPSSDTRSNNLSRSLKSSFFTATAILVWIVALLTKLPKATLHKYLGHDVTTQLNENIVSVFKYQ
jgi:hypothetical protein